MDFSPDGQRVAASSPGAVTVWDIQTESVLQKIEAGQYQRATWSQDGKSLAVDGKEWLVNTIADENMKVRHSSPKQYGAAFSPDGKLFAATRGPGIVVSDRRTGADLHSFRLPNFQSCVAFSPDSKWLAGGSGSQTRAVAGGALNLWDLETGKPLFGFDKMPISVWGLAFSPDGKRLAAATGYYGSNEPGDVRVWDMTTGSELYDLKGHTGCVWSVAFSPDGRRLVSASGGWGLHAVGPGEVIIWDMITGQEVWSLRGHSRTVYAAAFSPCGRRLATASADGTVKIWDGTPLAEAPARNAQDDYRKIAQPDASALLREAYSWIRDGTTFPENVIKSDPNEIVHLIQKLGSPKFEDRQDADERLEAIGEPAWRLLRTAALSDPNVERPAGNHNGLPALIGAHRALQATAPQLACPGRFACNRVAFVSGARRALVTSGGLKLYDLDNSREIYAVLGHTRANRQIPLAVSKDGRNFLVCEPESVVVLGDVDSGKMIRSFVGHNGQVNALAFSPDATRAVSGGNDRTLRFWNVKTGNESGKITCKLGNIKCVAYAPDGRYLLSGHSGNGSDNLIVLWDVETGKEVRRFAGHTSDVTVVEFLPDGRRFLSASLDGTIRLWSASSGSELLRLEHPGGVRDAALSPDGREVLSAGSSDKTIRLWDLANGSEIYHSETQMASVLGVSFAPDSSLALSASADGTVCLWRLPKQEAHASDDAARELNGATR